jgi:hypothetical protein
MSGSGTDIVIERFCLFLRLGERGKPTGCILLIIGNKKDRKASIPALQGLGYA